MDDRSSRFVLAKFFKKNVVTYRLACTNWIEKGISLADTPVIGLVEGKIGTRGPFTNFWTVKNLHGSAFSLHATSGNRPSFLAANSTAKVVRTRGVYLVWTVQRAFWKRSEQENSEGKGHGARAVETPIMVLFNKSSFQYTRFWYTLRMVYFDSSCQHSRVYYSTGNTKWQRWDQQLEGLLSKKALCLLARLAALRPKKPAPHAVSTVANFTVRNIHFPQLVRALRNSRGWYLASLVSSHESEVKWFL